MLYSKSCMFCCIGLFYNRGRVDVTDFYEFLNPVRTVGLIYCQTVTFWLVKIIEVLYLSSRHSTQVRNLTSTYYNFMQKDNTHFPLHTAATYLLCGWRGKHGLVLQRTKCDILTVFVCFSLNWDFPPKKEASKYCIALQHFVRYL